MTKASVLYIKLKKVTSRATIMPVSLKVANDVRQGLVEYVYFLTAREAGVEMPPNGSFSMWPGTKLQANGFEFACNLVWRGASQRPQLFAFNSY